MHGKKMRSILAVVLAVGMSVSLFGCGSSDEGNAASSGSGGTSQTSSSSAGETADVSGESSEESSESTSADSSASDSDIPEIYTLEDRNALSGLTNPYMNDRSDIEKALPSEDELPKSDITIGLSMGQMGSAFFTIMLEAAEARAEEYGYNFVWTNADSSITQQSADVEAMITSGYDVIIINPMDVTAAAADVQRAVDAGIVVIGVGAEFAEDVPVLTSILANNYFGGWYSGLYMGEFFEGQHITAAAILGVMGHTIDESRINGMIAGIIYTRAEQQGEPFDSVEDAYLEANTMFEELRDNGSMYSEKWDLDIVATGEGSWTNEGGLSAAEDIIAGHADELNLIMASCDPMGAGAITAIKNAGLTPGENIYVGCAADGGQEMFPYLESGEMLVTGYNSPDLNGSAAIDLVHMIFEEGYDANNLPAATDLPYGAITGENWEDYYDPDLEYCKILDFNFRTIDEIREEMLG
jgi:ribose transport system substrate-binding protein